MTQNAAPQALYDAPERALDAPDVPSLSCADRGYEMVSHAAPRSREVCRCDGLRFPHRLRSRGCEWNDQTWAENYRGQSQVRDE